jgi:hypothetical protein
MVCVLCDECPEPIRRNGVIISMDEDILSWNREELIAEVVRLRTGIRAHRDSSGHDLCWHHSKALGPASRTDSEEYRGPCLASVFARLRQIPGGTRPGTSRFSAHGCRVRPLRGKGRGLTMVRLAHSASIASNSNGRSPRNSLRARRSTVSRNATTSHAT